MRDNISPEEKLLRLIRGKKKQDTTIEKKPPITIQETKPFIKYSAYPLIQKYLSFLYIRKIIWVAFLCSFIYLIISFVYPWFGLKKIKLPKVTEEKIMEPKKEPSQEIKPFEFYQKGIENRQIFSGASVRELETPTSAVNVDIIKDINLVGIISGENPQAIIEDKKIQKTYYVTKGQFIGEMQIEDIREGKIIINYKGQRFELYL